MLKNISERIFQKKNLALYLLVLIILLGIFLRFYNTPLRYSVGNDSSRDALVVFEEARELQLPFLGPFSSLGPFTFGPWYYYQLIIFKIVTHLPYAAWIYLGLASTVFIFLVYKIEELLISRNFGFGIGILFLINLSRVTR